MLTTGLKKQKKQQQKHGKLSPLALRQTTWEKRVALYSSATLTICQVKSSQHTN